MTIVDRARRTPGINTAYSSGWWCERWVRISISIFGMFVIMQELVGTQESSAGLRHIRGTAARR
jgi:hypothetical protein